MEGLKSGRSVSRLLREGRWPQPGAHQHWISVWSPADFHVLCGGKGPGSQARPLGRRIRLWCHDSPLIYSRYITYMRWAGTGDISLEAT